jgi:hypothetical protein
MEKLTLNSLRAHQTYKTNTGEKVAGASTIAKLCGDPGGLLHWAWKCGMDGLDYKKVREKAANIGTIAHLMCEAHCRGLEYDLAEASPQDVSKAENSYLKFIDWWEGGKFSPLANEIQLVSSADRFGATLDIVCTDAEGRFCLVELKSSKALYLEHRVQMSGQEQLWNFGDIEMVNKVANPRTIPRPIDRRFLMRIGKEEVGDFEARELGPLGKEWEVFKACRDLYMAKQNVRD